MRVFLFLLFLCLTFAERITIQKAEELRKSQPKELSLRSVSSCPNDCSGHGTCSQNSCQCYFGYAGTDCSLEERELVSGQVQTGSVDTFHWKFYYLILSGQSNLEVVLNQTTAGGDCDLYIQQGTVPTREVYYTREISTAASVHLSLSQAAAATWYFGVYGFASCSYALQVSVEGECPEGCHGHGSCLGGNCQCDNGFAGPSCGVAVTTVALEHPVSGHVNTSGWQYYAVQFGNTGNQLLFSLSQTSTGDADIYIRYGTPPGPFSYDYVNVSVAQESSVVITDPAVGWWFVGIHGFVGCDYTLTIHGAQSCPNNCSEHGTCHGMSCACQSEYTGDYCQTRQAPLQSGEQVGGWVSPNTWNYFAFESHSVATLLLHLSQRNEGADCDVYVARARRPSRTDYDYSDVSLETDVSLLIADPGDSRWEIGIYGWAACRFTFEISETSDCPSTCTLHGSCGADGSCVCQEGWTGVDCSQATSQLQNNQLTGVQGVTQGSWQFFTFTPSLSSSLHVALVERGSLGHVWLYIGKAQPSLTAYEAADTSLSSNRHHLSVELSQMEEEEWIIGVYGNPFLPDGQNATYQLVAWAPQF